MKHAMVAGLVLLGMAGSGVGARQAAVAKPPAQAKPPAAAPAGQVPPAPAFDGDVAALAWGGRLESMSGSKNLDAAQGILAEKWSHRTDGAKGPVEVVVSFFKRQPVLLRAVRLESLPQNQGMRDVEVWTTDAATPEGFAKVAQATVALEPNPFKRPEVTLDFEPVQARFLKVRFLNNQLGPKAIGNPYDLRIARIQAFEGQAPGYVPLLTRHPEIVEPVFVAEGAAATAQRPVGAGCAPDPDPALTPGDGESRDVLLLMSNYLGGPGSFVPLGIESGRFPKTYASKWEELKIFGRVRTRLIALNHVQPWMLADVDTVVLQQACDLRPLSPRFRRMLTAWVAAGHKLIIHDSDKCGTTPDYSWLPYKFKSDNPGAFGKPGSVLRLVENNWMAHTYRTRPGFVDTADWVSFAPPANELGDSNAIMEWDPGWCGHMVVKNADGIFGVVQAYAHHGRGLIVWDGLDVDMVGTRWLDVVHARQLAQGFDTDNLPCSVKVGSFIVTTEPRLAWRGVQPGQTYEYPLSLFSNLGYKGTVSLSAAVAPPMPGVQTRFDPATVEVSSMQQSALSLTMPAGAVKPFALEVKGTAADGKTNSLCLQAGPVASGELAVISKLAPPAKTRKNLEIILDASGSMKAVMAGKKTRWDVALETLDQVLNTLPDDFNVGLRMYGHREPSTSPKTCTDTELLVPVKKLNRTAIVRAAAAFKPKGETPLVYSSLQAPSDLKSLGGGTVILITDGEESCKGDPVKAAADLKASGLDVRLNIVGFALKNPKTQKELAGFAEAAGGLYYAAEGGAGLADAITVAAIEKFPYTVYDAAGKVVLASEAGSGSDPVPPGTYKVVVKAGARELVAPRVNVALGQSVTLSIAMKNSQLVLQ